MLRVLRINHLAIIDKVEVDFHEGFNVLTGETGAGKSILIGALGLLLGDRVPADIIRTGEDEAQVEALFELPERFVVPEGLDESVTGTDEVILARRVFRSGRSRCSINGSLATMGMLQSLGRSLVTIFGQLEHHVLLNPDEHVDVLDRFGGLMPRRAECREAYSRWKGSLGELGKAQARLEELERQSKENRDAVKELTRASLKENEEEELVQEREIVRKAVQIREKASWAHNALYARSGSIIESFADVRKAVDYLVSANPKLSGIKENLEEAVYRIEDVAMELRSAAEQAQSDPSRLERIEERLALIRRLKRKYGTDVPGLFHLLESLNEEAGEVLEARADVRRRETAVMENRQAYLEAARALSKERKRAALDIERSMENELRDLAMAQASFEVVFQKLEKDKGTALGLEKVEFFLTANPGEAPRPLSRVASGGELSRIMLALKALQVEDRPHATVIFDEVDAGIGGHTAFAVGARLARVAERQQVLCVTHLHQIAARADHHLSVTKSVKNKRTQISVVALDEEKRVEELARMLGASTESKSAKDHVRHLMDVEAAEVSG